MTTIVVETEEAYTLLFAKNNVNWQPNPEYNLMFIKATVQYLQHKLDRQGYLFVNDVRLELGFDPTPDGQVSGWIRRDGYLIVDAEPTGKHANSFHIKFKAQGVIINDFQYA